MYSHFAYFKKHIFENGLEIRDVHGEMKNKVFSTDYFPLRFNNVL